MSLTACSAPKQIIKTEYIKQQIPALPDSPEYYPVRWHKSESSYCVDLENAKNLLKNRELDKAYQQEMKTILEQQKEER